MLQKFKDAIANLGTVSSRYNPRHNIHIEIGQVSLVIAKLGIS
ncbi:hypothetical protein [Microcoleus sp. FACHB-831]|nr:hypothetical protein [Microcoleus sp. FACHB-831]